jgi:hypothetical protein
MPDSAKTPASRLAAQITHCPEMVKCLKGDPRHPCSNVVLDQWPDGVTDEERRYRWPFQHLLPEPWTGHIEKAPLLFLASNPAGGQVSPVDPPLPPQDNDRAPELEVFDVADHPSLRHPHSGPKWWFSTEEIRDYYENLFALWVDDEDRLRPKPGEPRRKPSPYWRGARELVTLLYERQVSPGCDYALTEVVHCRSGHERGVTRRSVDICADLYLTRVLELSPAPLVVIFGAHGNRVMRGRYPDGGRITEPLLVAGRTRRLVYLTHPTAQLPAERRKVLDDAQLQLARRWLAETAPSQPEC